MKGTATRTGAWAALTAVVDFARREPGKTLALVLGAHLIVWTLLPALICPNLQLDLAEDIALGKEWQLGYWKHPPLPWWIADLLYQLTGDVRAVYVLGPLAAVVCFYGVWLLAREVVSEFEALIAVLILEGIHFYNFSVVKFAHDQMQLPFWAFTALFFHRAITRERLYGWILAGVLLAGAFWSKYAAFALAATLGIVLFADPVARRAWRTPGPYVMALAFLVTLGPNLWWLLDADFMPFRYVDERARMASHWYEYLVFPMQWIAGQAFFLTPAIGLLALLFQRGERERQPAPYADTAFNRRYVTLLALGPFIVTTLTAAVLGRLPVAMWGYPLWTFAPLAAIMWLGPFTDARRLQRFTAAFIVVFVAFPLAYAAVELFEPFVRDRPKATQFPGQVAAEIINRDWRDKYGTPLVYVGGTEFAANNVAVYAPDRPHVVVHGDPALSPWIDMGEVRRQGAVLVWEEGNPGAHLERWRATFSGFEIQPTLVLARQTWYPVKPARVVYAFVPPRP